MSFAPKPGDIVLARGHKLRHKLTQLCSGLRLNHALVYCGDGETQELNFHGVQRKNFSEAYANRDVVILRLQSIDAVVEARRHAAFRDVLKTSKMRGSKLDIFGVLLTLLRLPTRNRRLRYNTYLCSEYVEQIYLRASNYFDKHDFRKIRQLDVDMLMRERYTDTELLMKYNLIKVYDYRGK